MEILQSELRKELAIIKKEDEFYERIEAPKFVDFTVPDRSRPDDKSWFCVRIGCDQQHEEVDPDALYRSFMLRVMASRSPNLKLRKAINPQAPRLIKNSPRSAPAKSAKDRISRFSTITSIPEKMAKTRLKDHPVSSLRSTPNHAKAKVQPLTSDKKALTTPRNKKCPSNQEPFRSVKYQKAPVAVPKNRTVAKALFLQTPKRTDESSNSITLEVYDGMKKLNIGSLKKLNIGSQKKHTPGGRLCKSRCAACDPSHPEISSKKGEETFMSPKKKSEGCSLQEGNSNEPCDTEIESSSSAQRGLSTNVEFLPTSLVTIVEDSQQSTMADSTSINNLKTPCSLEEDSKENVLKLADSDDNKENDSGTYETRNMNSNTTNSESESLQSETCENLPQKAIRAPTKIIQEHCTQGGKLKRTTNPKPFRLRTDERGILKEANLERRLQLEAQKETASVHKRGDRKQESGKPSHGQDYQTNLDKGGQKAQTSRARTSRAKLVRFAEAKYATSNSKCQKSENNMVTEESQNKIVKMAPSRQFLKTQSVTAAMKVPVSQLRGKGASPTEAQVENSTTANSICSKGKRLATIPKEPIFHRIHVPKSCARRPEMVIS